ncbi:MAG: hypothetical protein QOD74_83 [Variibacter sp.]|nr:hypothetical protein [Variibacter sp.]
MNERTGFEWMARGGYAARGLVFVVIGVLSGLAAFGARAQPAGTQGALRTLFDTPFGSVLLWAIAIGLAGFALWRLMQGILDADHLGRDRKAVLRRAAYVGGGLFHLGLAAWAVSLVFLGFGGGDEDRAARDWTAWLLAHHWGSWIVLAIGAAFCIGGIAIVFQGMTRRFQDRLSLGREPRKIVVLLGRIGFTARGVLFVMIGVFLIMAAAQSNARQVHGVGGALQELQRQPYGWIALSAAALALLAYGIFESAQAMFRRVHPPSTEEAKREIKDAVSEAGA